MRVNSVPALGNFWKAQEQDGHWAVLVTKPEHIGKIEVSISSIPGTAQPDEADWEQFTPVQYKLGDQACKIWMNLRSRTLMFYPVAP